MDVQLKVLQGKPHGHCLRFGPGEFVFGRGQECQVRPNSELVSRQHCLLKVQTDGRLLIRDLGSANGTLVNGSRVVGERPLANGDTLQLGPVVLQVILEPKVDSGPVVDPAQIDTAVVSLADTVVPPSADAEIPPPKDQA